MAELDKSKCIKKNINRGFYCIENMALLFSLPLSDELCLAAWPELSAVISSQCPC